MKLLIRLILAIIFIAYPFVLYFGLLHFDFWQVSLFIILIALLRLLVLRKQESSVLKIGFFGAIFLLFFSTIAWLLNQEMWLKIYPIAISLTLLYIFASSLWTEKSIIQRFAELREKDINATKQMYMRKLTIIWCWFFIFNALISGYTLFFLSTKHWMLYNGFISYLLMGMLGLGELTYRHWVVMRKTS